MTEAECGTLAAEYRFSLDVDELDKRWSERASKYKERIADLEGRLNRLRAYVPTVVREAFIAGLALGETGDIARYASWDDAADDYVDETSDHFVTEAESDPGG